jgi:hypothetical protein
MRRRLFRHLLLAFLPVSALSCGGSGGADVATVTFAFRIHGADASEEFRFRTSSNDLIAKARAQLGLPQAQRTLFPAGRIAGGNGGYNMNWSWHFTDLDLVENAIELCDGRPSLVEADLTYWVSTVGRFCPWAGYVYAEIR